MTEPLNSFQLIETRTLVGFALRLFMVYILYLYVTPPTTTRRWEKKISASATDQPSTINKQDCNTKISNIDKNNVTMKRSIRGVNVYGPYKKNTLSDSGTNANEDHDDQCRNEWGQRRDYDDRSKNHPTDKSVSRAEPWMNAFPCSYACDPRDIGTPDEWIPRDGRMIRLTGRHPLNCETPVKELHKEGFLTPQNLHVIRNHGAVPKLNWETHVLKVHAGGQGAQSLDLSMEVLDKEFPHTEFPVTISCCGNRRKEINMIQQTIGFNWGIGGIGTCLYKGVLVRDILIRAGLDATQDLGGKHVEFIGAEDLPNKAGNEGPFKEVEPWGDKVKYATSIPLSKAMSLEDEVMVALECNGEPLHPDRGYPCRLVVPGFIGGRMIKWLSQIRVLDHESYNCYHYWDNKYLPPQITAERAVQEGWWYKQDYIINELSLNSVITYPNHNDTLSVIEYIDKKIQIQGYAHAGGGRPVTRVEISTTQGEVWDLAEIHRSEMPNPYGKFWCWIWWTFEVDTAQLQDEIWVRAWDSSNSPQPERPVWTLMGQSSNHIFRVKVHVDTIKGTLVYRFEHPTQPGQQTGGWATRVGDKVKSAGYGKIEYAF